MRATGIFTQQHFFLIIEFFYTFELSTGTLFWKHLNICTALIIKMLLTRNIPLFQNHHESILSLKDVFLLNVLHYALVQNSPYIS